MTATRAVAVFAIVTVCLGSYARLSLLWTLGLPTSHLAGALLAGTGLFLLGLCVGERLVQSDRTSSLTTVGLALALSVLVLRLAEYATEASLPVGGLAGAADLPVPLLALALGALAIAVRPRRRRVAEALGVARERARTHLTVVAVAVLVLPVGLIRIPNPLHRPEAVIERQPERLVSDLLTNTYLAFNVASETEAYDRLSESVVEGLVAELYLDSRARLRTGAEAGDEVTVVDVRLVEMSPLEDRPASSSGGVRFTAQWLVTARIRHLQHVHSRHNAYAGTLELRLEEGRWKLASVDLSGDDRSVVTSGQP